MLRRCLTLLFVLLSIVAVEAQEHSIIIDETSFKPESGLAIDKIGQDPSKRDCARLKMHINRMTSTEIDQLKVVTIGGIVKVTKQYVSLEGNGLIVELTAKPSTRFYLHHDKYGDSNIVDLNLEGNKEYRLNAELRLLHTIVVASNFANVDVYVDDVYKGVTDNNYMLSIADVTPGEHKIKVQQGSLVNEQTVNVSGIDISFRLNLDHVAALPKYVVFEVEPKWADVVVDGKSYVPDQYGIVTITLSNGTYSYSVSANDYHSEKDTFQVQGAKVEKRIVLKPAFGWLSVPDRSDLNGANIFVDGTHIGTAPLKSNAIKSGEHKVRIMKTMYKEYEGTVVIKDNEVTPFSPKLKPDFADVTIKAGDGCQIYVDDELKGTKTWSGRLTSGNHLLEARKENHRSTTISKEISAKPQKQNITLESPTPITGYLNLTTSPSMASVKIDDKEIGESPLMEELLIGSHTVSASKKGYKVAKTTVTIKEGETTTLPITLQEDIEPASLSISSYPRNANVYIDGDYVGNTPLYNYNVERGKHKIKVTSSGYSSKTEVITVNGGESRPLYYSLETSFGKKTKNAVSNAFDSVVDTVDDAYAITRISVGFYMMSLVEDRAYDAIDSIADEGWNVGIDYNVILLGDEYLGIGVSAGLYIPHLFIPILMTFDLGFEEMGLSFDIGTLFSPNYVLPGLCANFGYRFGNVDLQLLFSENMEGENIIGFQAGVFF